MSQCLPPLQHGISKLHTALPMAVASLFIVLLLPRCQQQPSPAFGQMLDRDTPVTSDSLEWQQEGL